MKVILAILTTIMISTSFAFSQDPPSEATSVFNALMTATVGDNYIAFQQPGDAAFKSGITEEMFQKVAQQLAPILKDGYESTFLTAMKQQGFDVYVWKITPKTGSDQFLARLVLKEGKASGFWIQ